VLCLCRSCLSMLACGLNLVTPNTHSTLQSAANMKLTSLNAWSLTLCCVNDLLSPVFPRRLRAWVPLPRPSC
jgi:hypothetical protein